MSEIVNARLTTGDEAIWFGDESVNKVNEVAMGLVQSRAPSEYLLVRNRADELMEALFYVDDGDEMGLLLGDGFVSTANHTTEGIKIVEIFPYFDPNIRELFYDELANLAPFVRAQGLVRFPGTSLWHQ